MGKAEANSGDATERSWKGCGGLGIMNWLLLLLLVRVITTLLNQFLSLCTGEHKENESWRHSCMEKDKIIFNLRVKFMEKLFEKAKLKVAFSFA